MEGREVFVNNGAQFGKVGMICGNQRNTLSFVMVLVCEGCGTRYGTGFGNLGCDEGLLVITSFEVVGELLTPIVKN